MSEMSMYLLKLSKQNEYNAAYSSMYAEYCKTTQYEYNPILRHNHSSQASPTQ